MNLELLKRVRKQLLVTGIIGFLLTTVLLTLFTSIKEANTKILSPQSDDVLAETQIVSGAGFPKDAKTIGILLIGYGGAGHEGGYLTDVLQVLYLDFEKNVLALVSIPRDLWLKLPDGREMKINTVLTSGNKTKETSLFGKQETLLTNGMVSLKNAVSTVTGLRIDFGIAADFVGFQKAVGENLDGIEVEVSETLDDPWYPIKGEEQNTCGKTPQEIAELSTKYSGFELERQFECRYEHLLFHPGIVHMEGGEALKYVRSRHGSAAGDISRGKRQQEVLRAIRSKLFSLNTLSQLPQYYEAFTRNISTDISLDIVNSLAPILTHFKDIQLRQINLSTNNTLMVGKTAGGQSVIYPKTGQFDWNEIKKYIQNEINK